MCTVGRTPGVDVDVATTYRLLSITTNLNVCKDNQESPGQLSGFPLLSAYPGDLVQSNYLENGHIWKELEHVDPAGSNSGIIYWYGTQNQKSDRTIDEVLKWNRAGTGGDKEGMLLSTSNFDDGTCIEAGQEAATNRTGGPCTSYFRVPESAEPGKLFTIYWVWDYSKHFGNTIANYVEVFYNQRVKSIYIN